MPNKRQYWDYLNDIRQAIDDIQVFTKKLSFLKFKKDRKTQYAVIRAFEIIGEAVKKLPIQIKKDFPKVPWKEISGMRDILVHEYFGVDVATVWETIKKDIPELKPLIKNILNDSKQQNLF